MYDIIGVAETKPCENDVINFHGYTYFSKHRKHFIRRSGGLGIFLNYQILPYIDVIDIDSDFRMLLRISKTFTLKDDDVCIPFVYLPPEGSVYSNNDSLSDLLPFGESCRYFYVIGDLNARTGTTSEFSEFNLDQTAIDQYGINNDVIGYLNNV